MRQGDSKRPIKLITDPDERGFDPAHPRITGHVEPKPMLTMITPGRRALGEDWSEVKIGSTDDEITVEVSPTAAPAHNRPIIVAHEGEMEMIDYILEATRAKAAERDTSTDLLTAQERHAAINEAWQDYIGDKLAHFHGRSTIGAGGMVQRQRVNRPSNF